MPGRTYKCHSTCAKIRGQLWRVTSPLPPSCGFQESESGHHVCVACTYQLSYLSQGDHLRLWIGAGAIAQWYSFPSMHEALSSIPSITTNKESNKLVHITFCSKSSSDFPPYLKEEVMFAMIQWEFVIFWLPRILFLQAPTRLWSFDGRMTATLSRTFHVLSFLSLLIPRK